MFTHLQLWVAGSETQLQVGENLYNMIIVIGDNSGANLFILNSPHHFGFVSGHRIVDQQISQLSHYAQHCLNLTFNLQRLR